MSPVHNVLYNKIIPAPAIPATVIYAPSCKRPISNRGTVTAPAALFFVEVEELEALDDPDPSVAVATLVTVPVPAVPAWLKSDEQLELVDPV